jgi:hypothetical protein
VNAVAGMSWHKGNCFLLGCDYTSYGVGQIGEELQVGGFGCTRRRVRKSFVVGVGNFAGLTKIEEVLQKQGCSSFVQNWERGERGIEKGCVERDLSGRW